MRPLCVLVFETAPDPSKRAVCVCVCVYAMVLGTISEAKSVSHRTWIPCSKLTWQPKRRSGKTWAITTAWLEGLQGISQRWYVRSEKLKALFAEQL